MSSCLDYVQTLFLYSEVMEYQIVVNTKALVMLVFVVKVSHWEQQSWQFKPLMDIDIPS